MSMDVLLSVCTNLYLLYFRIVLTVNFNVNAWLRAYVIDFGVNLT